MPELPSVEYFKRQLEQTSFNKVIVDVLSSQKSLIKKTTFDNFRKVVIGKKFISCKRRGKFLVAELSKVRDRVVFHFGMTGSLAYVKKGSENKIRFSRLVFIFKNGDELHWLNQRKIGRVFLVKDLSEIDTIKFMGPEPLDLSEEEFLRLLDQNEQKNIKAFLMNQHNIAGIGNIYSDEILFRARIDPHSKIKELDKKKKKAVLKYMKAVLREAIKIEFSEADFTSDWLLVHRNKDMKCPKNSNHELLKEKVGGRSAIYCPIHQKR